jgi:molecular chaperone DnaJ
VDRERRYSIRIPPGSTGGSTQRVPREGAPGRRGGPSGDLHVIVRVRPHPFYSRESTREGDVLVIEVPLSFAEAAVGAEIDVPVLDGIVRMRVPPGTQAGTQFRLRGKGFPRAAGRGDAHVRIFVETPASLSGDAQAALEKVMPLLTDDAMPRRQAFRAVARARVAKSSAGAGTGGASSAEGGS